MIKRALYNAPETAKLLAYTSLCRPHYAASVWDPCLECLNHDIEMIIYKAVRFISNIKGRERVTEAREKLCLDTLVNRRKKIRHNLLLGSYPMKNTIACWLMTMTNCAATTQRPLEQWPGVFHQQYMPRLQSTTIAFFLKL